MRFATARKRWNDVAMAKQNWATNINFHDSQTLHPKSVEELAQIIKSEKKVRARGSAHCFNTIADSHNTVVILDALPKQITVNEETQSVRVSAGMNYAEVSDQLDAQGYALHNLASLPHISVVGAMATGTHGSGMTNGALHTAAKSYDIMSADGEMRTITKNDSEFYSALVGLGLTGIITSVELEVEPTYQIYQTVFGDMPTKVFQENLIEVLSGGYNTNFFTHFSSKAVGDVWCKSRTPNPDSYFGAAARTTKVHPILSETPDACTEQLNVPGAWHQRLSHFRIDANPSAGNELQSEFFVARENAPAAFKALEAIAPQFGDKLLVSEIRSIAADPHWMSPAYNRNSIAFHCTWKNDYEVPYLIHLIEEALTPYDFRPHLGKLFNVETDYLEKAYPKFVDFRAYVKKVDPEGKFQNEFTTKLLGI